MMRTIPATWRTSRGHAARFRLPRRTHLPNQVARTLGVAETILGTAYVGTGHFCATVGAVDEATIKAYTENKHWDKNDESFKVTAPTKPYAGSELGALQTASTAMWL